MSRRRILFVDDEPFVIDGLRRMLRKQRDEWDLAFAGSGTEALACMAQAPFDVVVTDLRMPGMTGADLLERIVEAYPNTARIVLTGQADEDLSSRAANAAHQCLTKPADAQAIKDAVAQACALQEGMRNECVRGLVTVCDTLPSLPTLYLDILEAARSDSTDARQIGTIISRDMGMSAKLLKLVNSSFFGLGRRVSSVEHAVSLLGLMRIKALVLSEKIFKQFQPPRPIQGFSMENLWQHSLAVAEVARLISKSEHQTDDRPDQAFTAGMLHDVGILVLAANMTERFETLLTACSDDPRPIWEVEKEALGVTHGQIGGYLLGLWGLPPRIVEAVALHHDPAVVAYNGLCALTCVHVADALVTRENWIEVDNHIARYQGHLDLDYLQRIKLAHRLDIWSDLADRASQHPLAELAV